MTGDFYVTHDEIEKLEEDIYTRFGTPIFGECDSVAAWLKMRIGMLPLTLAEEEKHAKWEFVEREDYWIGDADLWEEAGGPYKTKKEMPVCSNCKTEFGRIVLKYKRCPECGAHMDLEEIEERCKSYPHR